MKRTAIALALIAVLLFPLTSYAGVLAIPIGSIRFPASVIPRPDLSETESSSFARWA